MNNILEINHLTMKFGGLVAIDDVSFNVEKNTITSLIGPNGAEKLLYLIVLLDSTNQLLGRSY